MGSLLPRISQLYSFYTAAKDNLKLHWDIDLDNVDIPAQFDYVKHFSWSHPTVRRSAWFVLRPPVAIGSFCRHIIDNKHIYHIFFNADPQVGQWSAL